MQSNALERSVNKASKSSPLSLDSLNLSSVTITQFEHCDKNHISLVKEQNENDHIIVDTLVFHNLLKYWGGYNLLFLFFSFFLCTVTTSACLSTQGN